MLRTIMFVVALSVPFAADAGEKPAEAVVVKDIPMFVEHQLALRADLEGDSKKFAHIKASSKRDLYRSQDRMLEILKGKQTIDDLNADERVTVYNLENEIAAILKDADDDRPICERTARVGSHFKDVDCRTKHERDLDRSVARQELLFPRTCDPRKGSCGQ